MYVDEGFTGTTAGRPGLDQALAAVHAGDTLIVPKLDRFARSVPDARALADLIISRGARLQIGPALYDPKDPFGKMFFNILASFAEFEVDLIRLRTIEGMARARQGGTLKGKQPKLNAQQRAHLLQLDPGKGRRPRPSWPSCSGCRGHHLPGTEEGTGGGGVTARRRGRRPRPGPGVVRLRPGKRVAGDQPGRVKSSHAAGMFPTRSCPAAGWCGSGQLSHRKSAPPGARHSALGCVASIRHGGVPLCEGVRTGRPVGRLLGLRARRPGCER